MESLWPWLTLAGFGALHGLNPANGWLFAAAWGVRSRNGARALSSLLPIAAGHAASIAVVVAAVTLGLSLDRRVTLVSAGALLIVVVIVHRWSDRSGSRARFGHAGLALWSFMMSSAHGAGLMLVPALMPLCTGSAGSAATTASESLSLALAAVGVHTAAMLAVTGALAAGVCRGLHVGAGCFAALGTAVQTFRLRALDRAAR